MKIKKLKYIKNKKPSKYSIFEIIEKKYILELQKVNQLIKNNSNLHLKTNIVDVFENHFLQIESLLSIYRSLPNLIFLPTTRGWAGSPDFLNKITELTLLNKPNFVFEVGSGSSTVIIGQCLKKNKSGNVLSLEHEAMYTKSTQSNLTINELDRFSNVKNCPLKDYLINGVIWKWYNINDLDLKDKIDLLIIDGPPRTTQHLARYPAIPILYDFLSDNVIILLDDANRPDEIVIVKKWIEFLEKKGCKTITEHYSNYEKGLALIYVTKNT